MEPHREVIAKTAHFWPEELDDTTMAGRQKIVDRLEIWLRRERQRGVNNNWTYLYALHDAIHRAWLTENRFLAELGCRAPAA